MWVQGLVAHALELLVLNNSFFLLHSNTKFITRILNQFWELKNTLQTLQNILYETSNIHYLKHVMLKTSVPVKFLLTALASFCKDKGGRAENCFKKLIETFTSAFVLGILYPLCQTSAKFIRLFLSIERATSSVLMSNFMWFSKQNSCWWIMLGFAPVWDFRLAFVMHKNTLLPLLGIQKI